MMDAIGWRLGRGDGGLWDGLFGRCRPKAGPRPNDTSSRIGNRIPRFPVWGGFQVPDSRFPIGRESGIGNRSSGNGPFPDSAGTGNRGPGGGTGTPARHGRRGFPGLGWLVQGPTSVSGVQYRDTGTLPAHRAGGISVAAASPNASTAKAGPAAWHSAHDHDNLNQPVQ
jgi:hypothetical protein